LGERGTPDRMLCGGGCAPKGVAVTILADRGFGDVKLFEFLESLDEAPELRSFELAAQGGMKRAF